MRKRTRRFTLTVSIIMLLLTMLVQGANAWPVGIVAQQQCNEETKTALYKKFMDNRTANTPAAYEAAKQYLQSCPNEDTDIAKYLKKWTAAYDATARELKLPQLIYTDQNFVEAYALGKQVLAADPDNLRALIDLGYGGYLATIARNETFNSEAANYARRALQLIESGKSPADWKPFADKDNTLAWLNYTLGTLTLKTKPSDAIPYFLKAAQYQSEVRKQPSIYYLLAVSYETGPYNSLSEDIKARFEGKPETPESKQALENLNQLIDRIIDAYARAVATAGSEPKYQQNKTEWTKRLTELYNFRHADGVGLNELIAGILAKPLPPLFVPATPSPATPSTASTGSTGQGANAPPATGSSGATVQGSTGTSNMITNPDAGGVPRATLNCKDMISSCKKPVQFVGADGGCSCFACEVGTPKEHNVCTEDDASKTTLFGMIERGGPTGETTRPSSRPETTTPAPTDRPPATPPSNRDRNKSTTTETTERTPPTENRNQND